MNFTLYSIIFIIGSIFICGCATDKVYVDTDAVGGLGVEVQFPGGKVVPIEVKRVIAGNLIELTNGEKVFYIGLYIPQIYNIPQEAKRLNERIVLNNQVRLEFDKRHRDSKGRLLAYAFTLDGRFINAEIIKEGLAKTLTAPPNIKYQKELLEAENDARNNNKGIWSKEPKKRLNKN